MKNNLPTRPLLARLALELAPPLIRETLLVEPNFREEYGFEFNAVLSFGDIGIAIHRSELFESVRRILSGKTVEEITDLDGSKWILKNVGEEGAMPSIALCRDEQCFTLPDLGTLSPDSAIRLRSLDEAAFDVNLPSGTRDVWYRILAKRPLNDDEVDVYHGEFRETPVEISRSIANDISAGKINIATLVPCSRRYFDRLVGAYDGSSSIQEYAAKGGKTMVDQLMKWRPYYGFLFALLLSSHLSLTKEINVDELKSEDLLQAFDFLDKYGDWISQIGAIEVGLRIVPSRPEIKPILMRLITRICDEDLGEQKSGFNLLSALFILVDGELSNTQLLSARPPFYRRLAALAQASLIQRELMRSSIDIENFCKWAIKNRGTQFYLQSLVDTRLEPRWNPDYAAASQLKADLIGRLIITTKVLEQNIEDNELLEFIRIKITESIPSPSDFIRLYLPGPLEGNQESQNDPPSEILESIQVQLRGEEITPSSFFALVNSALIFRIDTDQADLAAKALKFSNYRLVNIEDKSQLVTVLIGLATVTAVTRNKILADELRILVRRYMHDTYYALSVEDATRICLVASACHADLNDWRNFTGDWLTELAFGDLKGDDGEVLLSHLKYLCTIVPELWVSCGRADAALMAYNASQH